MKIGIVIVDCVQQFTNFYVGSKFFVYLATESHLDIKAPIGTIGFAIGERTVVTRGAHQQFAPLGDALYRGVLTIGSGLITAHAADGNASAANTNDNGE